MFLVNAFYWLWIFIIPSGILGFLSFWLYIRPADNFVYSIILSIAGIILGIILAEFVRKRYGLDNFFGRISATPDIDGENVLDQKNEVYGKKN